MTETPPRVRRRGPRRLLSLLAALALLTFVAAEVALRVQDARAGRDAAFFLPPDFSSGMYEPHHALGYVLRPGYERNEGSQIHVNALGLRGPEVDRAKAPGVFRIACLGGSTTFGTGASSDATTYPAQLQVLLDEAVARGQAPAGRTFQVLNAGVGNWNSADSLINFQLRLLDLEPDAILVYHAANDVRLIQSHLFRSDYSHIRRPPPIVQVSPLERYLLTHVRTYAHLARGTDPGEQYGSLSALVFADGFQEQLVPSTEWINRSGLATLTRNLASLVAVARHHGVVPVLSTFAVQDPAGGPKSAGLGPVLAEANTAIEELGRDLSVPVVPAAERLNGRHELYQDWMHFNDRGERRHAEVVLAFLLRERLFGLDTHPSAGGRGGQGR
jgi:hypothetical protein